MRGQSQTSGTAGRSPSSAERRRAALERFARFFAELRETFLEREDVLTQLALALIAREHVLITGPPGTGKSRLAASVVGRVVRAETGEPSLFAKQFTESTVQTELIGPVDFRTLTETGRTEHFTDEGMLGAVHAFLDEVLDGRDMLLRSTLNILEERELKQGARITAGEIECAVMTSNRYLTEVLEESRQTLLAFVDRVAFVAFVPRGFADPTHLERIVGTTLGRGIRLSSRLTVEDVDVLQEMVDEVRVPKRVVSQLVRLARAFEERAGQRERSDPTFTATRYFSTRAVARLARLLRASVLLDKATARPDRSLTASVSDLGPLRLAMMLAGPRVDEIDALLAHESDPRERRQLQIMQAELELFRECLRELSDEAGAEGGAEGSDEDDAGDHDRPAARAPEPTPDEPTAERRLNDAVTALTAAPEVLEAARAILEASRALEDEHPPLARSAQAARGHALVALTDTLAFDAPTRYAPTLEDMHAHLTRVEDARALREALLAAEVAGVDRQAEADAFAGVLAALVEHAATVFDRLAHDAVAEPLAGAGPPSLDALLDALRPALGELRAIDARLGALGAPVSPAPSDRVLSRRVAPSLAAAYAASEAPDRARVAEIMTGTLAQLAELGLAAAIDVGDHLEWVADALVRGHAPPPTQTYEPSLEGYRALRAAEDRTPMAYALAEVVATLSEHDDQPWEPGLEAVARALAALPPSLRERLAAVDLERLERCAALLEAWHEAHLGRPPIDLLTIAFEERALLRFALEGRLLGALFPGQSARADAIVERLRALTVAMRGEVQTAQRANTDAQWAELLGG